MIDAIVVAQDSDPLKEDAAIKLEQFAENTYRGALVAALRRIIAGDRDEQALLVGLDRADTASVREVLSRVGRRPESWLRPPAPGPAARRSHPPEKEIEARQAATDPELSDLADPSTDRSHGELARSTLTHLVTSRPELSPVLERTISLPADATRCDPATLAIGGMVLIALQTELKLSRNESGQWRFALHKKPMRDSTLGRVLGKLIGFYGTSSD